MFEFLEDMEIPIEHAPAKLVLFGFAMLAMWVLPATMGIDLATKNISETQMIIYKVVLSIGLAVITHFVIDRIAD